MHLACPAGVMGLALISDSSGSRVADGLKALGSFFRKVLTSKKSAYKIRSLF
jgi:hypothetical protein